MSTTRSHHKILVIGAGQAGISVAARLRKSGQNDVAILEPSDQHYYQPLWTLVGGGCATAEETRRPQASVIPKGVRWIRDAAAGIDPDAKTVTTESGSTIAYEYVVVAPGIQLDWGKVPGMQDSLGNGSVSSNYRYDLAPKTWDYIRQLQSGTALFTIPAGAIKCPGAPQKIAYLAAHYWQQQGRLDRIHIILALPTPSLFGVPEFRVVLEQVVKRYGIEVRFQHELVGIDPGSKKATFKKQSGDSSATETIDFDFLHVVPPQSAPDWIKKSPIASTGPGGYVDLHKNTMQHVKWPNVFGLGDAGNTPNSKTGAAVHAQVPVVVQNLQAVMNGRDLDARYDGYAACPFTTARNKMLLAEFDYTMKPHPTFPLINTKKERRDMWFLKRTGLPFLYWNFFLRGRA